LGKSAQSLLLPKGIFNQMRGNDHSSEGLYRSVSRSAAEFLFASSEHSVGLGIQKLALHARQMMPEAQVAGIHSQIAKVSAADKTGIPGRWDSSDRVLVHFDANGKRLAVPEVRLKPEVVDGVITTFFGSPYYNFPFAFFGTSASAPTVTGVVALMLQSAGRGGSLRQNNGGTFSGFTAHQLGVGSDAEQLGSGGTFTVKFVGQSNNKVTAAILNGAPAFGYSPFDGFGLIDAIRAGQIKPASSQKKI
jgi:hypothetical protein